MEAIREADRKDKNAQETPIFARLNTVNLVKEGSDFQQWLTAMRMDAQKIHDELSKKGAKRNAMKEEQGESRRAQA